MSLGKSGARGVTFHKKTRRWEAHIWDKGRGRQLYLGSFDSKEAASITHDKAAIAMYGPDANINNCTGDYSLDEIERLRAMSPELMAQALRKRTCCPAEEDDMLIEISPNVQPYHC